MRIRMTKILYLVFSATAIALLLALLFGGEGVPSWTPAKPVPITSSSDQGPFPPTSNSSADATMNPRRIAQLFALPPPPVAEAKGEVPESPQPTRAEWIVYLGYSTKPGTTNYFFKDARGARVISLSPGERKSEWKLVDIADGGFILQVGSSLYSVSSGH